MLSWAKKKDGFTDAAEIGTRGLQRFNYRTLGNPIPTADMNIDIAGMTETLNTRPSKESSGINDYKLVNVNIANIPTAAKAASKAGIEVDTFKSRQEACEATGNGDQFDHLSNLAATQDPSSNMRCGWVYNSSNPANGRGAYGTMDGPFETTAKGKWMWDLNAAQKKYHTQICAQVKNCQDMDASTFGGRCGWDKQTGKAIPIKAGALAYPGDTRLSCSSENLVNSGNRCPPPPPPTVIIDAKGNSTSVATPASICTPLANGHLSRQCLVQKVHDSGCSSKGTLMNALRDGSDSNYIDQLSRSKAFTTYQNRALAPLDVTSLKTGAYQTTAVAMDDFKRVNDHATSSANYENALGYAARDLCFERNAIDKFDFCTELRDTTQPPYDLDCVQKEFLRVGGQKSGKLYPNQSSMSTWNTLLNWKAVKEMIYQLSATARMEGFIDPIKMARDCNSQKKSMTNFYGINLNTDCNIPEIQVETEPIESPDSVTGPENGTANITCSSGKIVQVKYKYGKGDKYTTQTLSPSNCVGQNSCKTVVNNSLLGDPNIGIFKDFTVTPICQSPYVAKGCWGDIGTPKSVPPNKRALPTLLAIGGGGVKSIDDCYGLAAANGYDVFGNQYYGECWAGKSTEMNTPETSWKRYGMLDESTCGVLGTGGNNKVFKIVNPPKTPTVQNVYANNGSVSCETYCRGIGGSPWNGELPVSWNGAKCIGSPSNPGLGCNSTSNGGVTCTCEKTGTGWN